MTPPATTHGCSRPRSGDALAEEALQDSRGDWPEFYRLVVPWARGEGPAPVEMDDVIATLRVLETAAG